MEELTVLSEDLNGIFLPAVVRPILDSYEAAKQVPQPALNDDKHNLSMGLWPFIEYPCMLNIGFVNFLLSIDTNIPNFGCLLLCCLEYPKKEREVKKMR
ncbi:hypothetical protein CFP56_039680 [Quercus suber]|uniref:Uncharacterized protein n=1 Tax=Quercus suber TaxID=58331 RepID=A0AAW0M8D4_QUESU